MALDSKIVGNSTGNGAEVTAANYLKTIGETNSLTSAANIGGVRVFGESDMGYATGVPYLLSAEVDADYRTRVSQDIMLDDENFNYTAQNTGKHTYLTTTMVNAWTAGLMTTNSGSITTTTTGTVFQTYAFFPITGTQTLSNDCELAFSAQPQTNTFVEFGFMLPSTVAVAPTDGVFFRLNASGLQGIASFNGAETSTGIFPSAAGAGTWAYTNDKRYQFIVYASATEAHFWVNDGILGAYKLGSIPLPAGQGRICMSSALPFALKQRITGGAGGGVIQAKLNAYSVRIGGSNMTTAISTAGNRMLGSYQGQSGGTMGTLARVGTITTGNEANVSAAVPTTTTAALGSGLGGTFWETATLAVNTDGIIASYQVPAGTANLPGRRLVLRGMYLTSYIQTAITGGPFTAEWFLAFGHTAVSLGTAEAAATKAPRRIALPFTQQIVVTQAVQTAVAQGVMFCDFGDAPVFVNPGEFVALCTRHIGTAGTAGTIVHRWTPVFGWE
jgi:hypothetical protein